MEKDNKNYLNELCYFLLVGSSILCIFVLFFFDNLYQLAVIPFYFLILSFCFIFCVFRPYKINQKMPVLDTGLVNCFLRISKEKYFTWQMSSQDMHFFLANFAVLKKRSKTENELFKNVKNLIKNIQINNQSEKINNNYRIIPCSSYKNLLYIDLKKNKFFATKGSFNMPSSISSYNAVINAYTQNFSYFRKIKMYIKHGGVKPLSFIDMGFDFKLYRTKSISGLLKLYRDLFLIGVDFTENEKKDWKKACEDIICDKGENWASFSKRAEKLTATQEKAIKKCAWYISNIKILSQYYQLSENSDIVRVKGSRYLF